MKVYLTVEDAECRARINDALHRRGWVVVEQPTGFHLVQAIADVVEGTARELPALIVVDAYARGCTGTSIAAGLRALGVRIPIVLVHKSGEQLTESDDPAIRAVVSDDAIAAIAALERLRTRCAGTARRWPTGEFRRAPPKSP
jgi:DNA-binding response OmpR family regulator